MFQIAAVGVARSLTYGNMLEICTYTAYCLLWQRTTFMFPRLNTGAPTIVHTQVRILERHRDEL